MYDEFCCFECGRGKKPIFMLSILHQNRVEYVVVVLLISCALHCTFCDMFFFLKFIILGTYEVQDAFGFIW